MLADDTTILNHLDPLTNFVQFHPVSVRIHMPLAMFARLFDIDFLVGHHTTNKAFIRANISPLCVRINQTLFFPLAQAAIFSLLIHFVVVAS